MDTLAIRVSVVVILLFTCCGILYVEGNVHVYGLCDVGDVISTINGSLVPSKGSDCTRVILAPKGWRIKFSLFDVNMREANFDIHDGGRNDGTRKADYAVGHQVGRTAVFYTSSNALLLHTNRISSSENRLNASFEMFPQSAERCICPPSVNGQTICSLPEEDDSGRFYSDKDELERKCTTSCDEENKIILSDLVSDNSVNLHCELDESKASTIWVTDKPSRLFDPKLITCNKVTPATQVFSVFTFNYLNIPCADLNISLIESGVNSFLISNMSAVYVGECFKNTNENCTVRPVLASCSTQGNPNISLVNLQVKDNIKMSQNVTETKMQFNILSKYFTSELKEQLGRFLTNDLVVDGKIATNFRIYIPGYTSCPGNQMTSGPQSEFPKKSCIPCPLHYYKHYYSHNFYSVCEPCPSTKRRELNESMCVNGSQVYPKPSYSNCVHTCSLGQFFNNNSGICEWCDYGSFQNSTSDFNPVCKSCPAGNTTAFVGARSKEDCMDICHKGQFVNYPSCIDCAIGYYMPYKGNQFHKCYRCPSGKTTLNMGTANQTDCVDKCSQGEYFNISQAMCVLCPNNTFQDEVKASNTRSCKECSVNSLTLSTGSTSSSSCLGPCSSGEYLNIDFRRCQQCPVNTYNDLSNHTSFKCKSCGKHKITQNEGSRSASQCIYTCDLGEFFNASREACEKCANNTYQDRMGQDFCAHCPGNTFTLKTGSKTCITPCHFGQFLNKSAEFCQDCPVGYFQNNTNYVSGMCSRCPVDFYTNKEGTQNCTACPDQGITVVTGATVLSECIERCHRGFYLNKTAKKCEKCLKGFYQDKNEYRYEPCTKCASADLTTLGIGATSAEQCVGYCASSPCLNGAECTNIDNDFNCSCPQFLTGKQCETVIDRADADQMEISIKFTDLIWNRNLSDHGSKDFKKLASQIENVVQEELKNDPTFRTVKVKNFKNGSVISRLEFIYVAGTDFGNPLDSLRDVIVDGKIGNLSVNSSSLDIVDYTCTTPLGMENGRIPDDAITSANKDNYHPFTNARLNHNGPGWTPRVYNIEDAYLQVDLQEVVQLTEIGTQGSSYSGGNWLEFYRFNYSVDGKTWLRYKEDTGLFKVFPGNSDVDTVVRNQLKYPVRTRYVRLIRERTSRYLSYRCEFYGCPIPKDGVLATLVPPRTDVRPGTDVPPGKSTDSTGRTSAKVSTTGGMKGTESKSNDDDDDGDSNVGLIVGLVLGIVALIVFIGVVVWYFGKKKKSRSLTGINALPLKVAS